MKILQQRFIRFLLIPWLFLSSGCVYVAVGSVGALGGYLVSPDTVEGMTSRDPLALWDGAVEILSIMGKIDEQDEHKGFLNAKIGGTKVTVSIEPITDTTTKVRVKARKGIFPKISVAQDVFVKVMSHLNE